ncbi:glycerol-3-phosphate dehydrogenase/oxidase (plasmid) [Rhizobium sp. B230/85]|nr:glycerol-3-phosphate dehydrogenase/oxidase [Rhizobium sp. L58/93]MBO9136066.1 glycerol-3-phosphate dehydrogenase/oxidase [Rhizobium sp. B209b/85]MBO9171377.1 glycerol-3-phosphate dehydrogenase/oxidase [Rhizobium sp. L245/93]MBO9187244.1 glycerol-3-phosphate dehydrogenase/oxidase [Rhizobium sp. E27B/91]QXZ87926.1 glycerol-3-phosphate dehydrogenase/oxidase [Rhizobium sp. K1/93]QXZ93875.1 glycerol-3-phosphate dehydrogenase/oxidase [Rhizobium sp. K15/93]QXZ99477.1 glycerol-3-phosphate dehydrog
MTSPETASVDFASRLATMTNEGSVDVVILGAGINGAGLFRDLCAQGINCLIVEKTDFGAGTSAAPSRLIHGGLKYLETGEFGLVAQSTLERNLLLKNAPHCVTALPTIIPIFSWTKGIFAALRTLFGSTSAPRSRGAILIKIGLSIYDYYGSRDRVMPRHKLIGRKQALRDIPAMTKSIVATGTYYDAKISHPERLVLELVTDGLDANPRSAMANYTTLTSAKDGVLTFQPENGPAFSVRPKFVVNAAGPWIDHVNAALGVPSKMIGGTKGSHILLKHDELLKALDGRMIYFEADDGRICLVYDYLGLALVGSTDIPADNPDSVVSEPQEIDYMINSLRGLLPGMTFDHSQIVYAYSGIRPLPASNASIPGLISRDHSAPVAEPDKARPFPIISLIGGKWTTFRGFAEEVTDTILKRMGASRKTTTRAMPIGGGKDFPTTAAARAEWLKRESAETGLDIPRLDQLLTRYGTKAREIARYRGKWTDRDRLPDSTDHSLAEIDYILQNEGVEHLSDIVMRRTTLAITGSLTLNDLQRIAATVAVMRCWDETRVSAEIDAVTTQLAKRNHMRVK